MVEGVLQMVPHDNHNMLRCLRKAVEAVVGAALAVPKFTTARNKELGPEWLGISLPYPPLQGGDYLVEGRLL
jgi:hypothetical protein